MQDVNSHVDTTWLQVLMQTFPSLGLAEGEALTVCDSNFDEGQRFLSFWQCWRQSPWASRRLHYIGFDPSSLDIQAFAEACGNYPPTQERLALQRQWLTPLPGINRLEFDGGRISLTLFHMPLKRALLQGVARVNLHFLDRNIGQLAAAEPGFGLCGQLARLSARGAVALVVAGSHLALLSEALKRAGFLTELLSPEIRMSGSGPGAMVDRPCAETRFDLRARLRENIAHAARRQSSLRDVAVVGAGVSGAGVAYALALRGHRVHVFDAALAVSNQGVHQGHLGAAVTPVLSRDDDYRARLSRAGARLARARWGAFSVPARPEPVGTVVIPVDDDETRRLRDALSNRVYPESWVRWCDASESVAPSAVVRGPFVYFPEGMLIRPGCLIEAMLSHPMIQRHAHNVSALSPAEPGAWALYGQAGEMLACVPQVVLANAAGVIPLLKNSGFEALPARLLGLQAIPGQVSYFDTEVVTTLSRHVLDGEGYWLPPIDGLHVGGGTYDLGAREAAVTSAGHVQVIDKIGKMLDMVEVSVHGHAKHRGDHGALRKALKGGWAGWRTVVPGRLPVIGELEAHKGVWVASAYGSRGLTWSALAGEVISALLNGEPVPLERELLRAIMPG